MIKRSAFVKAAAAAGVALATLGTASVAHAGGNVAFSIGANIAPGVTLGISNAPYYAAPAYYPPAPVYYQPAPIYYQPAPVYYQPAVYVAPRVVYARPFYGYGHGGGRGHGHGHGHRR
jgi:hypothetical protein